MTTSPTLPPHTIELVTSDTDRKLVEAFLWSAGVSTAQHDSVPKAVIDRIWRPVIAAAFDGETGRIVGAALSCLSASALPAAANPQAAVTRYPAYLRALDKHHELDMIAVSRVYRGRGIGTAMLEAIEGQLRARGVTAWFGRVEKAGTSVEEFFVKNGFDVSERVPPYFGAEWTRPPAAAAHFHKRLW